MTRMKSRTRGSRIPRGNKTAPAHMALPAETFPHNIAEKLCEGRAGPGVPPAHLRVYEAAKPDGAPPQAVRVLYACDGGAGAHDAGHCGDAGCDGRLSGAQLYVTSPFVMIEIGNLVKANIVEKRLQPGRS